MDNFTVLSINMLQNSSLFIFSQYQVPWVFCHVLNIILIVLSIWQTISVAIHGKVFTCTENRSIDKNRKQIFLTVTIASAVTLPRLFLNNLAYWIGYDNNKSRLLCEIVIDISVALYFISYEIIYLCLWLRQRTIYKQPCMEPIYTKTIKFLSWSWFFWNILLVGTAIMVHVVPPQYKSTSVGCREDNNITNSFLVIPINFFFVLSSCFYLAQIVILLLAVYPPPHSSLEIANKTY